MRYPEHDLGGLDGRQPERERVGQRVVAVGLDAPQRVRGEHLDAAALDLGVGELELHPLEVCQRLTELLAHQVHGAIGFCDELPLSWLSRYSQPLRRLPLGLSATRAALASGLGRRGLTGLFSA